jgi:sulfopyruvate decarboxylase TPP-binding subunit
MVKAKEFFNVLCEELGYRFFSGIMCKEFTNLFKAMHSSFMHYVPSVNEDVGLGLVAGTSISGLGSVLMFDMRLKEFIYPNLSFLINNKLPAMLIGYSEKEKEDFKSGIPIVYFNDLEDLRALSKKIDKKSIPGLLIIGKDVIK